MNDNRTSQEIQRAYELSKDMESWHAYQQRNRIYCRPIAEYVARLEEALRYVESHLDETSDGANSIIATVETALAYDPLSE